MTDYQFPVPHNPDNSDLPFGQPHYPKHQKQPIPSGQSQDKQQSHAPTSPPPSTVPQLQMGSLAVDPGALRGCLFRDTYIRLANRTSCWFHPTYIDYITTSGFKWNGYAWIPWGTDLDRIVSFQCT